ncbi:hypothetical protein ACFFQF_08100 [Haladaptatus pallidirubidus]
MQSVRREVNALFEDGLDALFVQLFAFLVVRRLPRVLDVLHQALVAVVGSVRQPLVVAVEEGIATKFMTDCRTLPSLSSPSRTRTHKPD